MKTLRHGLVFLSSIHLSLFLLIGCAKFHSVKFISEACIKPYKRYDYHTCEPMHVKIDGNEYVIPKDFETDLASIPRLLWPIIAPQYSSFIAPSILHDYLYRCDGKSNRLYADDVLYSALITEGVTSFTAIRFYMAVRLFGASHYVNGVC